DLSFPAQKRPERQHRDCLFVECLHAAVSRAEKQLLDHLSRRRGEMAGSEIVFQHRGLLTERPTLNWQCHCYSSYPLLPARPTASREVNGACHSPSRSPSPPDRLS